jgi:hypothetical protein
VRKKLSLPKISPVQRVALAETAASGAGAWRAAIWAARSLVGKKLYDVSIS